MCVRSLGADEQMALEDDACLELDKPKGEEDCKPKEPCPGDTDVWLTGNWTDVSLIQTDGLTNFFVKSRLA